MKNIFTLAILTILFTLTSCEEVIEMNLNNADPVLVMEGLMEPDSVCNVLITYTSDYFSTEPVKSVDNALVVLEDNTGTAETLTLKGKGLYRGAVIKGKENNSYSLSVTIDGKTYSGSVNMMSRPTLFKATPEVIHGMGGNLKNVYAVELKFNSPAKESYYLIKYYKDNDSPDFLTVEGKYYTNNDTVTFTSPRRRFEKGDKVRIEVIAVDYTTYNYYRQLQQVVESRMRNSAAPYNPASNMGHDVLGCFVALSGTSTDVTIE